MFAFIRQEVADKWAVVLGLLCPYHLAEPVDKLAGFISKFISNMKDESDVELVLRGTRYLHFSMDSHFKDFKMDTCLSTLVLFAFASADELL